MRYAIIGSRICTSRKFVFPILDRMLRAGDIIVSGGAKGADSLAEEYAEQKEFTVVVYKAMWDLYGKSAGFKRNVQIIDDADEIIAFWDGKSKGTRHSINLAKAAKKPVHVYWI